MECYSAVKVSGHEEFLGKIDTLPRAEIRNYPWGGEYSPKSYGVLAWDGGGMHIYMRSYETVVRTEIRHDNGDVYTDSCLEFFFSPMPDKSDFYFNFEVNPLGNLYLAYGPEEENDRKLLTGERYNHFGIAQRAEADIKNGEFWEWSGYIPFAFVTDHASEFKPRAGMQFRGNFFKCGEFTQCPHYGTWNDIIPDGGEPQFHQTKYFGAIDFVNK
ncbi:MAG: carbohydrate-binding family 9-like protein [Clostridia bacterium]